MPNRLQRLDNVWELNPKYYITTCTYNRLPILTRPDVFSIIQDELSKALTMHGWAIGSYCVMPDHIHFFCTDAEQGVKLNKFIQAWKQWTSKRIKEVLKIDDSIWQKSFFDHLIRSSESYSEKWEYVRQNPVRAGLVKNADDWKYWGYVDYK
jgi:REP element-mobilizing transposase RayT